MKHVQKEFTAETVPKFVYLTEKRIDTQMGSVLVSLAGWVPTVPWVCVSEHPWIANSTKNADAMYQ